METGWAPEQRSRTRSQQGRGVGGGCKEERPPTQRDDEEPHVAQPVGGLVGQLVHEEPEDGAEVVLGSSHRHLDGNGRLGVAVAAGRQVAINAGGVVEAGGEGGTYNLWMRETMVLKAAWMSAVVQVQTTGRRWFWSSSDRY